MSEEPDWGSYRGRRRLPCPEDPTKLLGAPIGQYHCPYCGMMVVAGVPHLTPEQLTFDMDGHPITLPGYEEEYDRPWPPGYVPTDG
jgi:hypothetical protein